MCQGKNAGDLERVAKGVENELPASDEVAKLVRRSALE
jgi:hypothetical protein